MFVTYSHFSGFVRSGQVGVRSGSEFNVEGFQHSVIPVGVRVRSGQGLILRGFSTVISTYSRLSEFVTVRVKVRTGSGSGQGQVRVGVRA